MADREALKMKAWGITDKGAVRQQNQDAFSIQLTEDGEFAVCIVCDGMGGARAGNVASALAVDIFITELHRRMEEQGDKAQPSELALRAVKLANTVVYEQARSSQQFAGMGTTLVAAVIRSGEAAVVNVGDSRAYRIGEEGIQRVTKDHSVVEDMVDRGDITPEEARQHPSKNLITRALGTEPDVMCDSFLVTLRKGEFLLLCSDGLINTVQEQEILYEVLHGGERPECCRRLLDIALSRGAPDNVTAILVEM